MLPFELPFERVGENDIDELPELTLPFEGPLDTVVNVPELPLETLIDAPLADALSTFLEFPLKSPMSWCAEVKV
jgi:hypothetical protein